jgi:hypothetical protein
LPEFEFLKRKLPNFYTWVKLVAKKLEGCLILKKKLSYSIFSQFWLQLPMNDCHFGCITKLPTKNACEVCLAQKDEPVNSSNGVSEGTLGEMIK